MKQKAYTPSRWACYQIDNNETTRAHNDISWKVIFSEMLKSIKNGERTIIQVEKETTPTRMKRSDEKKEKGTEAEIKSNTEEHTKTDESQATQTNQNLNEKKIQETTITERRKESDTTTKTKRTAPNTDTPNRLKGKKRKRIDE